MVGLKDDPIFDRVVWSGTMAREGTTTIMVVDRATRPGDLWQAPARLYNRTGKFVGKGKKAVVRVGVDNQVSEAENPALDDSTGPTISTFGDEGE